MAWFTGCVSELEEPLASVGSTDLKARIVVGVMEAKSWNFSVQSMEPVTSLPPAGSRVAAVTAFSCVLRSISCDTGNSSSSSLSSSSSSLSSSLSFVLREACTMAGWSLDSCATTLFVASTCFFTLSSLGTCRDCFPKEDVPRNFCSSSFCSTSRSESPSMVASCKAQKWGEKREE